MNWMPSDRPSGSSQVAYNLVSSLNEARRAEPPHAALCHSIVPYGYSSVLQGDIVPPHLARRGRLCVANAPRMHIAARRIPSSRSKGKPWLAACRTARAVRSPLRSMPPLSRRADIRVACVAAARDPTGDTVRTPPSHRALSHADGTGRVWAYWYCRWPSSTPVLTGRIGAARHRSGHWARPSHICTGTGLAPPTSASGLGSPLPHLHRDLARRSRVRPCPRRETLGAAMVRRTGSTAAWSEGRC
jgi:hypothetical protein